MAHERLLPRTVTALRTKTKKVVPVMVWRQGFVLMTLVDRAAG